MTIQNNINDNQIDKYLRKYEIIYDNQKEQNAFNEICMHYGLTKIDDNTYKIEKLDIIVSSLNFKIDAFPDTNKYFESNIYKWIRTYCKQFKYDKSIFLTHSLDKISMSSLRSLIIFLDFMTLYEKTIDTNIRIKNEENKKYIKRLDIYKAF